jgi:hypothetical protein
MTSGLKGKIPVTAKAFSSFVIVAVLEYAVQNNPDTWNNENCRV